MTQIKNPSLNHFAEKLAGQQKDIQDKTNENDRSQEVILPIPEKKNDEVTAGIKGEKSEENSGQTIHKPEIKNNESFSRPEKDEKKKTGFDPDNTPEPKRKDKRGDEFQRLERDDTADPKTKDSKWQQDRMNEANNQQESKIYVEKPVSLTDKREDSILDRPKTETYEKMQGENVGGQIKKDNYSHTTYEKIRDENNRHQMQKKEKKN